MSNYRIVKNAAVWWPVTWPEPADGGEIVQRRIELKFRRFKIGDVPDTAEMANVEAVMALAVDWRGIEGEDGKALPFDAANVADWTAVMHVPSAVGDAFRGFLECLPETRLGNSAASPAGGPAAGPATADQTATPTP